MQEINLSRRSALVGIMAFASAVPLGMAASGNLPQMRVMRDPSCGCCGAWVEHVRQAGFRAEVVETSELDRVKVRLGVPPALTACHTAEIAGYVIEGHVPASAIKRLLADKPQAKGLAVAGMPVGSPGMEVEGTESETYLVILFGPAGERTFARYRGSQEV